MIERKKKKCNATGKAKGYNSCGEHVYIFRYGMCEKCFKKWVIETKEGNEVLLRSTIKAKKDIANEKKRKIVQAKREIDTKSAIRLADTYFSRFIRLKHSINGFCTCYTCGTIVTIKECDNGHYMKREHKATRYHENNCRPQCKKCNGDTKHNGKQVEFRINLINEIGIEEVEKIEKFSKSAIKANAMYYREIAEKYRNKVNDLQQQLKVKYW